MKHIMVHMLNMTADHQENKLIRHAHNPLRKNFS